jgi:hypothetical protein
MTESWAGINPASITGFNGAEPGGGSGGVTAGVESAVGTAATSNAPLYSPENPLFWFALLLAGATGLFFVSTHVKVGPAKGSISI